MWFWSRQTAWSYMKTNQDLSSSSQYRNASVSVQNPPHIREEICRKVSAKSGIWLIGLRRPTGPALIFLQLGGRVMSAWNMGQVRESSFLTSSWFFFSQNAGTISAVFPLPEPTDIQLASQVTFDDVQADLARLEKRISDCDRKIQSISQQKDEKTRQPFQRTMSQVLDGSRQELQQQLQALQECKKRYMWPIFSKMPELQCWKQDEQS